MMAVQQSTLCISYAGLDLNIAAIGGVILEVYFMLAKKGV